MKAASITFVTGTDTDVGKTIATAALAATLAARGGAVAVYKPTQTGISGTEEPGDKDEVTRLSGVHASHEGIRLRDPMAPVAAAAREQRSLPSLADHVGAIVGLADEYDHVLVEGAGGVLVELDGERHTLVDLATVLRARTAQTQTATALVVVCRSGLGTLNHTLLTLEALVHRGLPADGLVIGSWPESPSIIERSNRDFFESLETPFLGALPAGASALEPAIFQQLAPQWIHGLAVHAS
ncbi:dethiobiotin synthase [Arthrobacter cryoconiti]|uniref:ATP-dependent dethiobiotin synthetase BioD n=1 Tax=Arthrobacter cryoconiti TaxID=748907 RepID=A0ABV8QY18_9MICC|nr:dethiobiotin synthase [Arthrobacter cryoconiti]MCC9068242.1 dethiobiotin synthase [Arthrobacter cryoconiti]